MPVANENGQYRYIHLVRAWAITILGVVGIIYGLIDKSSETIMLGFTVLGCEPMIRAKGS